MRIAAASREIRMRDFGRRNFAFMPDPKYLHLAPGDPWPVFVATAAEAFPDPYTRSADQPGFLQKLWLTVNRYLTIDGKSAQRQIVGMAMPFYCELEGRPGRLADTRLLKSLASVIRDPVPAYVPVKVRISKDGDTLKIL